MDRHAVFRRSFHIISPIFLGYYLLPESLGGGITRTALSAVFVGTALCIEIARIALGIRLLGLRPYEGQRVSAYAQGLLGLAFGLFVIRDPRIVVPVFLGMAWIDPLAALCRKSGWSRVVPTVAYLGLFLGATLIMNSRAHPFVIRIRSFACTRSISSFHRLTETSEPSSSTAFASQTLPVDPDRLEKSRAAPFSRIVSSITSTLLSGRTSLTFIRDDLPTPPFA